jgi:hypothetical protein
MARKINTVKRFTELPKPYYTAALEEINRQTDRGAAIAGSAFVDLLLRASIEKRLIQDMEIQNLLFQNRGPLQDFSARIQISYALKIIGVGAYADLCRIRDIRNAFAHSADAFGFDREDIAVLCDQLWYPAKIQDRDRGAPKTYREKFTRAIELISDGLIEDARYYNPGDPQHSSFLHFGPPSPHPPSPKKPKIRSSRDRQPETKKNTE